MPPSQCAHRSLTPRSFNRRMPTDRDISAGHTDSLTLHGLVKSFRGREGPVRAVRGVDLSIERGETVALLGPNGAGKSTTLDMVLGLSEPDAGSVSIFGRRPRDAIAAGEIGAMFQTGALIGGLSVRELVSMMAALYPRPLNVRDVLDLTGTLAFADQRTQKLSGGETQRARLALALVSDPELLVLDEPTVALDVEARRGFWAVMRSFAASGKTVVFATHYLDEADAYADRVVLIAHGEVVADGPTTEIKAMVGLRTIRATLPSADETELAALPGVSSAERHGDAVILTGQDSDAAIRALLERYEDAHDIEITGAGLEQAFLALTSDHPHQTIHEEVFA
jgi:ABC-2 type transport system ATP-binding protein